MPVAASKDTIMSLNKSFSDCELIVGNSNPRFSGVTSTMLQTLVHQVTMMDVKVLGSSHLPDESLAISFWQIVKCCRKPRDDRKNRVFHARRNNEMIQALLLKYVFGVKIKIVFTSTAQRFHSVFTRWLMSKMDAVISTCDAAAGYLISKPSVIIPHGIRTDIYYPDENRTELWRSLGFGGDRGIGIFGRVRAQKGVHHFVHACIEVLPRYPQYTALIVGAISTANQAFVVDLQKKITSAGLQDRIIFLGEQPFERIPVLFRAVSLVAALSRNEGFGLTALEAMGSASAVLATEAGAWKEVVRQGVDGCVVPADNSKCISESLKLMLASPDRLDAMGRSGRHRVEALYTVDREAKQLCDFFRTLQ